MKACFVYAIFLVVSLCIARGPAQNLERAATPGKDWLSGVIDSCAPHRAALIAADVRNRKLLGNAEILVDIDEKDRFVDPAAYEHTVRAAGIWLQEQFPVLRDAFAAGRVEACANVTTGMVYLRGRADRVDFAAIVPIGDVTGTLPREPWSITFVSRDNRRADVLQALVAGKPEKQAEELEAYLSQFGEIAVERVQAVEAQLEPPGLRIEGAARFTKLRFSGRLTLIVSAPVVHVELNEVTGQGRGFTKPWAIEFRGTDRSEPDWTGEANVRPARPAASSPADSQ
jgi:hypothetical protein